MKTCATLTPTFSLSEGEGALSIPSPPEGERDRVRGRIGAEHACVNKAGYAWRAEKIRNALSPMKPSTESSDSAKYET